MTLSLFDLVLVSVSNPGYVADAQANVTTPPPGNDLYDAFAHDLERIYRHTLIGLSFQAVTEATFVA